MAKTDDKSERSGQKFPKRERLCSKKDIEELFSKGSSHFLYPFKILYLFCEKEQAYPQVLFSVPKRNFKSAVSRNRIKRQMREIYRKNKTLIFFNEADGVPVPCFLGIIYAAKEPVEYKLMESKLISILFRLKNIEF